MWIIITINLNEHLHITKEEIAGQTTNKPTTSIKQLAEQSLHIWYWGNPKVTESNQVTYLHIT